jgi:hypothetical protein
MQLFTLGLVQLNPDGSPVLDTNGNPLPAYDQDVVTNVARILTGWTYPTAPGAVAKANNPAYFTGRMFAVERNHDTDAKTIFGGVKIPAGRTSEADLVALLDALMEQPTMAPFVCRQLIQHLVASNPSPAYIERVANIFLDNGRGVRGDMQAVITAILTDPEARAGDDASAEPNVSAGHLREPVLFMMSVLRGLNATLGDSSAIQNQTNAMGQNLFYPPSVFSYFSPQYRLPQGLFGPEFQIYSTQTAATRANVVNALIYGALDRSTKVDLQPVVQRASNIDNLVDYISYVFFHHAMSAGFRLVNVSSVVHHEHVGVHKRTVRRHERVHQLRVDRARGVVIVRDGVELELRIAHDFRPVMGVFGPRSDNLIGKVPPCAALLGDASRDAGAHEGHQSGVPGQFGVNVVFDVHAAHLAVRSNIF